MVELIALLVFASLTFLTIGVVGLTGQGRNATARRLIEVTTGKPMELVVDDGRQTRERRFVVGDRRLRDPHFIERAGEHLDRARDDSTADNVAAASIAVAEARAISTEISLAAGTTLFELGGSQATLAEHNLDRHWRNALLDQLKSMGYYDQLGIPEE